MTCRITRGKRDELPKEEKDRVCAYNSSVELRSLPPAQRRSLLHDHSLATTRQGEGMVWCSRVASGMASGQLSMTSPNATSTRPPNGLRRPMTTTSTCRVQSGSVWWCTLRRMLPQARHWRVRTFCTLNHLRQRVASVGRVRHPRRSACGYAAAGAAWLVDWYERLNPAASRHRHRRHCRRCLHYHRPRHRHRMSMR